MSKKQQFTVSTGEVTAKKSEYDDEELDVVQGKKIEVKSGGGAGGAGTNGASKKYSTGGKAYVHPPERMIKGRVIYPVKFIGQLKVSEPKGTKVVRNAIDMVKVAADVRKTNNPGWDIPEVDLSISIRSIMCLQRGTNKVLHQHPIHVISFSADDKRGSGNLFVYIIKPKPPATDHICYVYECSRTQAIELTATIGEAFELAYKKFLEAKEAQEEFKKLKERLETASPQEKEEIRKQLEAIEAQKAAQLAKKREAAEKREAERISKEREAERIAKEREAERIAKEREAERIVKEREAETIAKEKEVEKISQEGEDRIAKEAEETSKVTYTASDITSIKVEGPPKYYIEDTHSDQLGQDPEAAKQLAAIQKEVEAIESKSELEMQKQLKKNTSVAEKWENFTSAIEPFQSQRTQVKRFQMKELDDVISGLEGEISDLEEAFNWEPGKRKVAPYDSFLFEEEETDNGPDLSEKLEDIETQFKSVQLAGEEMEIPELPANFVMDEFLKAREKASLPKQGTVMGAATSWYQEHHD